MKQLKKKGLSYGSIGELFSISRQRVHQLISGYITPNQRKYPKYKWLVKLFESILERDNYKCQICKEKAQLVHHIDKDNSNNNPNNLVSLCNKCHLKLHFPNKITEWGKRRMIEKNTKEKIKKKCLNCNKEFKVLPSSKQIFCSRKCSGAYRYKNSGQITKCKYCGKEIRYLPSQWKNPQFCSVQCKHKYLKEKTDKRAIKIYKLWEKGVHYKEIVKQLNLSSEPWMWTLKKRGERLVVDNSFDKTCGYDKIQAYEQMPQL